MKKMISLLFVFVVCLSNITFAQNAGQGNVEALENINQSLERIESAITTLTSQNEENVYNQKKEKAENEVVLKDIKLQIKDIVEAQEKISKDVYSQKIEIENLKNIVAMLQEKLAFVEKKSNSEPKIEDKATKNPTDLLVVDNKEPKEIKEEKISDDESFKLAMENFNKKYFTESAINFASNLKNFPEGNNFHKNLLYLGLSMQKLENKNGACTAFAKIINSNEKIENEIRDVAVREFETLNCNTEKAEEKK